VIVSWAWNFGDGAVGSGPTAAHTYAASGSYSVTLTVTDDDGLTGSSTRTVAITYNNPPVASFTVSEDYLEIFVDASASTDDFGIVSYTWSYGDGGSGSGVMDSHMYAMGGTYTVSLTVVDTGGKSATTTQSVSVVANTPPMAMIALVSTNFLVVTLSGAGSMDDSGIASYAWNFGDGMTGSGASVTHTYAADGTYTVTLTVTDDHGLSDSATLSVTVEAQNLPPTAAFTYSVTELTVYVDASGSTDDHGIVSYTWNWGDGTTGSGVTASHTYSLTTTKSVASKLSAPIIDAPQPPYYVAGYTLSESAVAMASCSVTITNLRTGGTLATTSDATGFYMKDIANELPGGYVIGDTVRVDATKGTASGSTTAVLLAGSYTPVDVILYDIGPEPIVRTITLTVIDAKGLTDTETKEVTLKAPPVASFTASATYLVVQVDASASTDPDGSIASYAWNFGDGGTASGGTASHTYASDGTYTITLTVTDNDGLTDTDSKSVTVVHQPRPPTAAFSWTSSYEVVSFDASGSSDPDGTITAYAWNFGDGSTGSGKTVTHTYAATASYSVTLTVTDNEGLTGSLTRSVFVQYNSPPVAAFTVTKNYLEIFVDASASVDDIGIASYSWTYGDGGSGSGVMDSHTYAMAGTYTVTLTIVDNGGKSATTSKSVSVAANVPPIAVISLVSESDLTVSLSGSGSTDDAPIVSYEWILGDGSTSSGVTVTHTYAAAGTYTVSLTVTDSGGLTGSASLDVTVTEPIPIPERSFVLYDMFNVPWGSWWPIRWDFYTTDVILSNEPGMYTMMFWPTKSATYPYSSIFYAPYRFSFDDRNQSALSVNKPEFMPVFGPTVTGAEATVGIRFEYLEPTWWTSYWIPTWGSFAGWPGDTWLYRSGADGYDLGTIYTVNMNRQAAEQWLNMSQAADPVAWWAANGETYRTNWVNWISYEGNTRLDIYCGYEWPYDINGGTWMTMAAEPDGSVTLTIGHIALGFEILMTRWFVEAKLCSLEPYMEDFTLNAVYTSDGMTDVSADFVCQYSLHAVKANQTVDSPAWVWEPAKIDYVTKIGHPSAYQPYRSLYYTSWNAGDMCLGIKIPYEQTPGWFNLSANEKLTIQAPTGTVPGYRGVALTEDVIIAAAMGDLSGINAIRSDGVLDLGYFRTAPNEVGQPDLSPFWDEGTKTLELVGPMNFDNFRHKSGTTTPAPILAGNVLYHGAPWIEFNVVPGAAAQSLPAPEVTVRGPASMSSVVADSVPALAAIALASATLLFVVVRGRQEE
jgi:PKD repeat protein